MFSSKSDFSSQEDAIKINSYQGSAVLFRDINRFSVVLLKHKGKAEINFESTVLRNNAILFLCPGEVLKVTGYSQMDILSFYANNSVQSNDRFSYAFGNTQKAFVLTHKVHDKMVSFFDRIRELIFKQSSFRNQKAEQIILEILNMSPTYTDSTRNENQTLVYNFVALVHENFTKQHRMDFYADLLHLSSKRITEKFKLVGAMNPHAYIKKRLLTEIKCQLIFTDKTIKSICFDLGFNDTPYFTRFFKKNVGQTATQFRKKNTI